MSLSISKTGKKELISRRPSERVQDGDAPQRDDLFRSELFTEDVEARVEAKRELVATRLAEDSRIVFNLSLLSKQDMSSIVERVAVVVALLKRTGLMQFWFISSA